MYISAVVARLDRGWCQIRVTKGEKYHRYQKCTVITRVAWHSPWLSHAIQDANHVKSRLYVQAHQFNINTQPNLSKPPPLVFNQEVQTHTECSSSHIVITKSAQVSLSFLLLIPLPIIHPSIQSIPPKSLHKCNPRDENSQG